ncbi:MAG: ParB N-terminal domain-containing protein [Clostridium sp.]
MAKKFSISEGMLNGISKNTEKVSTLEAKENFKIEYIDIDKIIRNERNFYEINNIEELVEDISINGLNHNLVVRPTGEGLYELISGERRYTALKELISKGEDRFKKVPCKVSDLNDLDSEIVLIQANAQSRELSESDKLIQVRRLTELYNMKKKKGEKVGKVRDLISKDTGLSTSQVGRYSIINKSLIPELRSILDEGNLSVANASEFAALSEENQKIILDIIKNKVSISKNEANELKNKFKEIEAEKQNLIKKEEKYINEIHKLKNENETVIKDIDSEIEKIKSELEDKYSSDNEDLKNEKEIHEQRLKKLEEDKLFLEKEKIDLLDKLNNSNLDIDKIANEKAREIALEFENDKKKIETENKKLRNELDELKKDSSKVALNQELKIRLKTVRQEMGKVAGLMANNTIMDEATLKEVSNLKYELKFLNEQIELYTNQVEL